MYCWCLVTCAGFWTPVFIKSSTDFYFLNIYGFKTCMLNSSISFSSELLLFLRFSVIFFLFLLFITTFSIISLFFFFAHAFSLVVLDFILFILFIYFFALPPHQCFFFNFIRVFFFSISFWTRFVWFSHSFLVTIVFSLVLLFSC